MAVQGPLRELGIHDVFQLLDLSRKTGALTVTSALRDNQGLVFFDRGGVVHASIKSNPHRLGELLLRGGKITEADLARANDMQRQAKEQERGARRLGDILVAAGALTRSELERQVRAQVEEVVFELMSWREGFFSFEERDVVDAPAEATVRISTESLLMEGARRIDEWSRIERRVAHLGVVPQLAPVDDTHPTTIDLRPNEWAVLAEMDGVRDLRALAAALGRNEFDLAKIAFGLVSTGVIELSDPRPDRVGPPQRSTPTVAEVSAGAASPERAIVRALQRAMDGWERQLATLPDGADATRARAALEAANTLTAMLQTSPHV
ncbi:MAG: DUF4388 domain-containing protein [Gemmatimonadaceae bacterium]